MFGRRRNSEAIARARELKADGDLDRAVGLLREAGLVDEAAQWLAQAQRYREAARMLLDGIDTAPEKIAALDAARRKRVLMAAIYFSRGNEASLALPLFEALGEHQRAAELREKAGARNDVQAPVSRQLSAKDAESAGDLEKALAHYVRNRQHAEAGRVARTLGRGREAADHFIKAEQYFEAAVCLLGEEDAEGCLDCLVRIPQTDSRYRTACMQAIRTALEFGALNFRFDQFIGPFVESGPDDELEMEAFYDLAELYLNDGFVENAVEALEKIVAADAGFRDASRLLEAARDDVSGSPEALKRIMEDGGAFHRQRLEQRLPHQAPGPAPQAPAAAPGAPAPLQPEVQAVNTSFAPGSILAGRYRVGNVLGRGANAVVLEATDTEEQRPVAIKVLSEIAPDEETNLRFHRELEVCKRLVHRNVIRVYEIGTIGGRRFLSMELLRGHTLDYWMSQRVSLDRALGWTQQVCAGLEAAHERGVVHRDVKPANVFLTDEGLVKLMDFGLAREQDAAMSMTGAQLAGTPKYMAPEQINKGTIGPPTDLYAVGVMLYEMLTGQPPFEHPELVQLLMMHVRATPQPPRLLNPAIPEEIEQVVLKLLAKAPEDRYQSAAVLGKYLQSLQARLVQESAG